MYTSIATWNVNSIKQRIPHLKILIRDYNPSVILLQELKCISENFPYEETKQLGYNAVVNGQKAYNGVAIITKFEIETISCALPGFEKEEARYLEAYIHISNNIKIRIINIYAPQGQEVGSPAFADKMQFYNALHNHIKNILQTEEMIVLAGDYNIAYEPIDVYDEQKLAGRVGFNILEREKLRKIYNLGMVDAFRTIHRNSQEFTWWDYRQRGFESGRGMRIDNILVSPEILPLLIECKILPKFRGMEKPSDHSPAMICLKHQPPTSSL